MPLVLPTPSTSHVDISRVYEPAEDSFLLLDTLSSPAETAFLQQRFNPRSGNTAVPLLVEIGAGSGVVTAFITAHAREILGTANILTLGSDVNAFACAATTETVTRACRGGPCKGLFLTCVQADLSSALCPRSVDVLIFNPPYVPSEELPSPCMRVPNSNAGNSNGITESAKRLEEESHLLSLSYAGGMDGMEVTNKLLDQLPELLSLERGTAYILLCKQNKPKDIMRRIRLWGSGWAVAVVGSSGKTGGWEQLQILRIWRT